MESEVLVSLRTVLAELYPDESNIRRIIHDSGIELWHITLASTPINNWHSTLIEAEKIGRIDSLLDIVKKEYGNNDEFRRAYDIYCEALNITSPVPTTVKPKSLNTPKNYNLIFIIAGITIFISGITWAILRICDSENLLQQINFNYDDEPTNHGWQYSNNASATFTNKIDGFFGKVLRIDANEYYAIDHTIDNAAKSGTKIEFLVKPDGDDPVYIRVKLQDKTNSALTSGWLKILPGKEYFQKVDEDEWMIRVVPIRKGNDWLLLKVDVDGLVEKTFGQEGWVLYQLESLRIRGNMYIAYVKIYTYLYTTGTCGIEYICKQIR